MTKDSCVLPIAVACERANLSEDELLCNPSVQIFTRYLPGAEPELAVLLPDALVDSPEPLPQTDPELDAL
jgi:hypothetical protein